MHTCTYIHIYIHIRMYSTYSNNFCKVPPPGRTNRNGFEGVNLSLSSTKGNIFLHRSCMYVCKYVSISRYVCKSNYVLSIIWLASMYLNSMYMYVWMYVIWLCINVCINKCIILTTCLASLAPAKSNSMDDPVSAHTLSYLIFQKVYKHVYHIVCIVCIVCIYLWWIFVVYLFKYVCMYDFTYMSL